MVMVFLIITASVLLLILLTFPPLLLAIGKLFIHIIGRLSIVSIAVGIRTLVLEDSIRTAHDKRLESSILEVRSDQHGSSLLYEVHILSTVQRVVLNSDRNA